MPLAASPSGHVPVMCERVLTLLGPALQHSGAVLVDATVGLGGHAEAALERFSAMRFVGIDRDPRALHHSGDRLAKHRSRVHLVHGTYDAIPEVLNRLGIGAADAVLLDLGVSSMQLDDDERGFSYARDTALDMRMDPGLPRTAADVLNEDSVDDLTRILRDYGDERFARRIAQRITRVRQTDPITRSTQLVDIIRDAIPAPARRTGGNPAKRTFQALRIEVNDEIGTLRRAVPAALQVLALNGRLAALAYHSLEDRIVKRALTPGLHPDVPPGLPTIPESKLPWLVSLTRGAEAPDEAECSVNPRASSARLRAVQRIRLGDSA